MKKKYLKDFNQKDTMGIISSFPQKGGEVAVENAVARYTKLLVESLPQCQKVVIFSEIRSGKDRPYLHANNILIVPAYRKDSVFLFSDLLRNIFSFNKISDLLIQHEFSVFGGKVVVPSLALLLFVLKLLKKNTSIMLHQVVNDLSELAGHLGLKRNSLKMSILNLFLLIFYKIISVTVNKSLVHDPVLANKLANFVDSEKIVVIPHGVSKVKKVSNTKIVELKNKLDINKKNKIILVFGYQTWYKGTDWVVETFEKNPIKNSTLLLAGGESPTLKGTSSYQKYSKKLSRLLEKSKSKIVSTGYVKDKDVNTVFSMADVVVFPYRAKMSASGALSLAFGFGKPVFVSRQFSSNLLDSDIIDGCNDLSIDVSGLIFSLRDQKQFGEKLTLMLKDRKNIKKFNILGSRISENRKWAIAGIKYLLACQTGTEMSTLPITAGNLSYAEEA